MLMNLLICFKNIDNYFQAFSHFANYRILRSLNHMIF
jgi:hypothetical protein